MLAAGDDYTPSPGSTRIQRAKRHRPGLTPGMICGGGLILFEVAWIDRCRAFPGLVDSSVDFTQHLDPVFIGEKCPTGRIFDNALLEKSRIVLHQFVDILAHQGLA